MENLEQNPLRDFWEEIREVAKNETAAHFEHGNFNPEELTEEDMEIWEKLKSGAVTKEDLLAYKAGVGELSETRRIFLGFINNKAMGLFLGREIEQRKKQ